MPFSRPALGEIYDRIYEDMASRLGIDKRPRFSVTGVLAKAIAGACHMLYGYLDYLAKNMLPDSAERLILERWAAIWGVYRKAASFASGFVIIEGEPGSIIPAETLLQDSDAVCYLVQSEGRIDASRKISLLVKAKLPGRDANLASDSKLTLIHPIAGVNSSAYVSDKPISGGADIEDDASLRVRLLERIRSAPQGGAAHDYVSWAKEIPGVTRAWVYPLYWGPGTVGVTFVLDDEESIIAATESAKFKEVDQYLKLKAPVTAKVVLFSPSEKPLNPVIRVTPDTLDIRAAVKDEIKDLLRRESAVGGALGADGTIYLSRLQEAISMAKGEFDHVLQSPIQNIEVKTGEIVTLGEIRWL